MQIIDISWPISNQIVTYKNKQDVLITPTRLFAQDACRESKLTCGMHTGTHVDAPAHFLQDGVTLDQINLSQLIGKCQVFDMSYVDQVITGKDVEKLNFDGSKIVLFKTRNSLWPTTGEFDPDFVYLDGQAAKYLATKQLTAVGIDGLGIERNQPNRDTHKTIFNANMLIIEGLRLSQVASGNYNLVCLPLHVLGADGAPARAILTR